jgi:PIN domain nuclease of toxin-antitoxin system
MMKSVVIDTHILIWYLFAPQKLSEAALEAIQQCLQQGGKLGVSAISVVELVYLTEKNRLPKVSLPEINQILADTGREFEIIPVDFTIALALSQVSKARVPEMADRIIAATAVALEMPLITCDHVILASGIKTIW